MLNECHTLWVGSKMPAYIAGCLRSFVRLGHRVVVHVYNKIDGIPPGVELADASLTVPRERIFRHCSGSYAVFADYFRYKLLMEENRVWIDCDLYCIRPFDFADEYLYGREDDNYIAIGVLRMPPNSALLQDLLSIFEGKMRRPPWITRKSWLKTRVKAIISGRHPVTMSQRVIAGPPALTWLARKRGLYDLAKPQTVFYPVAWRDAHVLAHRDTRITDYLSTATRCIHLSNEVINRSKIIIDPESFLARVEREGRDGSPAFVLSGH